MLPCFVTFSLPRRGGDEVITFLKISGCAGIVGRNDVACGLVCNDVACGLVRVLELYGELYC